MAEALVRPLKPIHERMVLLYFMGKTAKEIAALTNYTPERVSEILGDPQSEVILEDLKTRFKENVLGATEYELLTATKLAAQRIRETMECEPENRMATVAFVRHQDKLGLELLRAKGYIEVPEAGRGEMGLPTEAADRLARAWEKADLVEAADYSIVDNGDVEVG